MTVRHRIHWLVLTAAIVVGAVIALWLVEDRHDAAAMERRARSVTARSTHLAGLNAALGYGGLIHSMKNFVLRGDDAYVEAFDGAHTSTIGVLARYRELPDLTAKESELLDQIRVVADDYRHAMDRAIALRGIGRGDTAPNPAEVDAQVRVDDADAFAALTVLEQERTAINEAVSRDIERTRLVIGVAKIGIGVAGIGLFVFLAGRITKPITRPVIAIADGSEIDAAAAAELVVQRHELRAILDAVPAYIYFKDDQNRILNLNKASADAIGLPVDEIVGRDTAEFFPPEDAASFLEDDLQVIASGMPKLGIEENHITETRGTRKIVTDKIPLSDPNGKSTGLVAIATDITDLRLAESKISEMNQLLDQSQRLAKQGGWSWDLRDNSVRFSET